MNAGCYGSYVADHLIEAQAVTRAGEVVTLTPERLNFAYRHSDLPEGWIVTEATFQGRPAIPRRWPRGCRSRSPSATPRSPRSERSAGSTFRNPAGFSSTGRADDTHELKAWSVIDAAGLRGARRGGAQMSEKHPNFLLNTGGASAADLEGPRRGGAKKGFPKQRNRARVGNHEGRRTGPGRQPLTKSSHNDNAAAQSGPAD